ncbi:MAG: hypothetical protein KDD70_05010 [Bdellovibrionales bacterium]|nr:hypothetical protein [Bdellovibrionales bacterium]
MVHDEKHTTAQRVGAIVLGLLIMAAAVCGYLWTEAQRSGATTTLNEILSAYEDKSRESPSQDHPFAYVHGRAESEEDLVDQLFDIKVRGVFFERTVKRLTKQVTKPGVEGGRTIVTYDWVKGGEPPFTYLRIYPDSLRVAGSTVSSQLLDWRLEGEAIPCDDTRIKAVPAYRTQPLLCLSNGEFSNRAEEEAPEEGDIRITFSYLPLGEISILGKLSDGILYPIEDANETYLYLIEAGKRSPEELVRTAQSRIVTQQNTGRWICLGIFLLGLFFFTSPFRKAR